MNAVPCLREDEQWEVQHLEPGEAGAQLSLIGLMP
jgi:hypothetical protein